MSLLIDEVDLVAIVIAAGEMGAVAFVDRREDAAADRDARPAYPVFTKSCMMTEGWRGSFVA
nr:hypothetical protein [Rhizobium leguminosarum]